MFRRCSAPRRCWKSLPSWSKVFSSSEPRQDSELVEQSDPSGSLVRGHVEVHAPEGCDAVHVSVAKLLEPRFPRVRADPLEHAEQALDKFGAVGSFHGGYVPTHCTKRGRERG
jgi:hypothetical protein